MFTNLKAYIRHGRQANILNRHNEPLGDISNPQNPVGVFPPGTDIPQAPYAHDPWGSPVATSAPVNALGNESLYHEPYGDSATLGPLNGDRYDDLLYTEAGLLSPGNQSESSRNAASLHGENAARAQGHYETVPQPVTENPSPAKDQSHYEAAVHIVAEENQSRQKYPSLANKYSILGRMGEGAFSVVYRALDLLLNTEVAIKIINKSQMDRNQRQAVLKEVTIMRQLRHPNIVRFLGFIDADDYYYIIQELVPGGEIFLPIVKYTYFSEDLARHVIVQVAEALRYLHEQIGVVHRDLKPENLLFYPIEVKPLLNPIARLRKSDDPHTKVDEGEFTPGVGGGGIGVVKLADFGLSKQVWYDNTGTPCGTVGYTAPEIVKDEKYSLEVDMWAVGCVLYTLLCGFPPFYDERIEQLTQKVSRGEYEFLRPWWDEISLEAKQCVSNLLCVDKSKRYTISDFLNDPWVLKTSAKGVEPRMAPVPSFLMADKMTINTPSARAMKDAFDISVAYYRETEEEKHNLHGVMEEEEEEDNDRSFTVAQQQSVPGGFDLSLLGATILGRRNRKRAAN